MATQNPVSSSPIPADVRERILQAAAELFEQSGRESFPTVDQVRRRARTDMNAASTVMREWRRTQTMQAGPVAVQIPEAVVAGHGQALAALWLQAQELANESLRAAQAGWDVERGELDAMRQEISTAFEAQASELEQARQQIQGLEKTLDEAGRRAKAELAEFRERAERAEARYQATVDAHEVQQKTVAADRARLEAERDTARGEVATLTGKLAGVEAQLAEAGRRVEQAEARIEAFGVETKEQRRAEAQRYARLEGDRDEARQSVAEARERAATLEGQLTALQEQNAALLARIPIGPDVPGKASGKK